MRAKIVTVALVIFGLFGAVAMTAPTGQAESASRGGGDHHHSDDAEWCIAEEEVLIGPVCVDVDDVDVDVLS
jgi:hypothetical protein